MATGDPQCGECGQYIYPSDTGAPHVCYHKQHGGWQPLFHAAAETELKARAGELESQLALAEAVVEAARMATAENNFCGCVTCVALRPRLAAYDAGRAK